jgi:hypothetical protein
MSKLKAFMHSKWPWALLLAFDITVGSIDAVGYRLVCLSVDTFLAGVSLTMMLTL